MNPIDFKRFLRELSETSEEQFIDPRDFHWPASVERNAWYFTPELISLYGTEVWESLDESARQRLSFFEAVNFFSLNIHGERFLISEISKRLYEDDNVELSRYLTHFVDEEARHMLYFSAFCERYARKVYPDRSVHGSPSGDDEIDTFLLFARINVFEEVVDHYNRIMASDLRLAPVVREINRIHHVEELRHLSFGRRFLEHCLGQHIEDWDSDRRDALREHVSDYLQLVWKQYYNPDVYRDAGIVAPFDAWRAHSDAAPARDHRERVGRRRLCWLRKLDLLEAAQ